MDRKKQQELSAIADEIVMLAKALKSVATTGTGRELEMGDMLMADCQMFECTACAVGVQKKII